MINRCRNCDVVLRDQDRIKVTVESTYHELKSKVCFSISRDITNADPATLEHVDCRHPGEVEA